MKQAIKMVLLLLIVFGLAIGPGCEGEERSDHRYIFEISGNVLNDSGLPIENVKVSTVDRKVLSNAYGEFVLDDTPKGNQTIVFQKEGYEPSYIQADIENDAVFYVVMNNVFCNNVSEIVVYMDRWESRLGATAVFFGQLLDEYGNPVPDTVLHVWNPITENKKLLISDSQGGFEYEAELTEYGVYQFVFHTGIASQTVPLYVQENHEWNYCYSYICSMEGREVFRMIPVTNGNELGYVLQFFEENANPIDSTKYPQFMVIDPMVMHGALIRIVYDSGKMLVHIDPTHLNAAHPLKGLHVHILKVANPAKYSSSAWKIVDTYVTTIHRRSGGVVYEAPILKALWDYSPQIIAKIGRAAKGAGGKLLGVASNWPFMLSTFFYMDFVPEELTMIESEYRIMTALGLDENTSSCTGECVFDRVIHMAESPEDPAQDPDPEPSGPGEPSLSTTYLNLGTVREGVTPSKESITIKAIGPVDGVLSQTAGWIKVEPAENFSLAAGESKTYQVWASNTLPEGTYTARLIFTQGTIQNPINELEVTVQVTSENPTNTKGDLWGFIVNADTGKSVTSATVRISGPESRSTTSDEYGIWYLFGTEAGTYTLSISKSGFNTSTRQATVEVGGNTKVRTNLTPN